jgi:nucleotide-binding universal stress UspA family protein
MGSVVVALQGPPQEDSPLVREAAAIARRIGGHIVTLRVVRVPSDEDDRRLARAVRTGIGERVWVETELLAASDPARAIADASRRYDADVVLVGATGSGLPARVRSKRLARRVRRFTNVLAVSVSIVAKGGS